MFDKQGDTKMDKNRIISEIKRTAAENSGVALGTQKFQKITGIKPSSWWGKYWRTWGEALKEAGFAENKLNTAHDKMLLISNLVRLTRKIGRFPASVDLRLARKKDNTFPSHNTFNNLGAQSKRVELVRKYAIENKEYSDILKLLPQSQTEDDGTDEDTSANIKTKEGYVYMSLLKMGAEKRYKIGKSILVERRNAEISLQLPEDVELIHVIKTDDAYGIEAYWHKRFEDKNTKGEWFRLTREDVQTFKKRKFM